MNVWRSFHEALIFGQIIRAVENSFSDRDNQQLFRGLSIGNVLNEENWAENLTGKTKPYNCHSNEKASAKEGQNLVPNEGSTVACL